MPEEPSVVVAGETFLEFESVERKDDRWRNRVASEGVASEGVASEREGVMSSEFLEDEKTGDWSELFGWRNFLRQDFRIYRIEDDGRGDVGVSRVWEWAEV